MIEPNHIYTLFNSASGTVLDLDGGMNLLYPSFPHLIYLLSPFYPGSPAKGRVCQGWQNLSYKAEAFNQQWFITAVQGRNDIFTMRNLRSGTYLDMSDGSSANGTRVQGYTKAAPGNEKNQQWKLIPEGQEYR